MKKFIKILTTSLALSLSLAGVTGFSSSVSAATINDSNSSYSEELPTYSQEDVDSLVPILSAIENIPDELLEEGNVDKIHEYFVSQGVDLTVTDGDQVTPLEQTNSGMVTTSSAWSCSLAIGELIVTNAIPIAKITKIKKYVKALGGVTNTAKLLVGATTTTEKVGALSALIAELTGFDNVSTECGLK